MDVNGKILFEEDQRFRVKWVWAVIIACVLLSFAITIGSVVQGEKMKEAMLSLWIVVPLELLMMYLFYIVRLDTIVTSEGIYYRWWPFQRRGRFIARGDIVSVVARKSPSMHYGWHRMPGYGVANTVGPGHGLQLMLHSGKRVFIGSGTNSLFADAVSKIASVTAEEKTKSL